MQHKLKKVQAVASAVLLAAFLADAKESAATVMVDAAVTPLAGGVFHYDVAVINDTIPDLFIVTIFDMPLGDPLIAGSLTSPAGFLASYDGGLGLLDLLADTTPSFPIGTTEPFSFDSLAAPGDFSTFDAFDLAGFPIPVVTGNVRFIVAAVPEAVTLSLFAVGLAGLSVGARRSGKSRASNTR